MSETEDEYRKRIQALVEKHPGPCPICGFRNYQGGKVHPFNGVHGYRRAFTVWCNGKQRIPSLSERALRS
jgi:hypothetical protein